MTITDSFIKVLKIITCNICLKNGQYKTWTADYGLRTTDWV